MQAPWKRYGRASNVVTKELPSREQRPGQGRSVHTQWPREQRLQAGTGLPRWHPQTLLGRGCPGPPVTPRSLLPLPLPRPAGVCHHFPGGVGHAVEHAGTLGNRHAGMVFGDVIQNHTCRTQVSWARGSVLSHQPRPLSFTPPSHCAQTHTLPLVGSSPTSSRATHLCPAAGPSLPWGESGLALTCWELGRGLPSVSR